MVKISIAILGLIMFIVSGCATVPEATWKTVPAAEIAYDRAWGIVVNTVSQNFEIETVDANSGYLRTAWKVTDTALGTPIERARVTVRVEERTPFKVKVKVEKQMQEWGSWVDKGNHPKLESEIMSELAGRLK
jgi:hypothetical protein